jgi:hypothetical protein
LRCVALPSHRRAARRRKLVGRPPAARAAADEQRQGQGQGGQQGVHAQEGRQLPNNNNKSLLRELREYLLFVGAVYEIVTVPSTC